MNKIRNISRIFIILTFVTLILTSVSAYASSLSVKSSSNKVSVGDEITVVVNLEGATGANSGGVEINFDSALSYVSGSGQFSVSNTALDNYDESTHKGAFAFSSKKNVSGNILTLRFKANADGTPTIKAKLTLRVDDTIVLQEESSVTITTGTGINSTNDGTNTAAASENNGHTDSEGQLLDENGNVVSQSLDENGNVVSQSPDENAYDNEGGVDSNEVDALNPDGTSNTGDGSSIFITADGSTNVTLIVIIIVAVLVVITVVVVVIYNKKKKKSDQKIDKET